jgi:hydrogenase expression/formation protein HypD
VVREFRDKRFIAALLKEVKKKRSALRRPCRIMEVCGTHTMTIHRYGLKRLLEDAGVEMISGPGCPVCITPAAFHEAAIGLVSTKNDLILATFGDMTRVPTSRGSLQTAVPAHRSLVKIIYSPEESLELARSHPGQEIVFLGVGFETTIPSIGLTVQRAQQEGLENFSLLSALWLIPPPLKAIVDSGEVKISGFLYPGHVSAIIGKKPYEFLAREYGLPGAIAGFEPVDILLGIRSILDQMKAGRAGVDIEYSRAVSSSGNLKAQALMAEMFEAKDSVWRGLGPIPRSGLKLKKTYAAFDADLKFRLSIRESPADLPGCRCGEVLRGLISPHQCPLFGKKCRPESPLGPCMVSFEGACLVHYKYAGSNKDVSH